MKKKYYIFGVICLLIFVLTACQKPEQEKDYSISLTQEQVDTFQSATSHLLRRVAKDTYYVQYQNCGAVLEGGKLTTLYDGMGAALVVPGETPIFPVLKIHSREGDVFRGSGSVSANWTSSWMGMLQVDQQQKTVSVLGAAERTGTNLEAEAALLAEQYDALPAFTADTEFWFSVGTCCRLVQDQEGKILPLNAWEQTSRFTAYNCYYSPDLLLEYIPLQGEEYYLLYEITDKEGKVYCSELIPYEAEIIPQKEDIRQPEFSVKWEKGSREQFLFTKEGLDVYLAAAKDLSGRTQYAIKVRNNTDATVTVYGEDVIVNGTVSCSAYSHITVRPGKFAMDDSILGSFDYGLADGAPELETVQSLLLCVYARTGDGFSGRPIFDDTYVQIDMTDAWQLQKKNTGSFHMTEPAFDALAGTQLLLEHETLRLTLVNGGHRDDAPDTLRLVFKAENLTPYAQTAEISGVALDGIFLKKSCSMELPGNCMGYMYMDFYKSALDFMDVPAVEKLQLMVLQEAEDPFDPKIPLWIDVALDQTGTAPTFPQGSLLWEHEGAQVYLLGYDHAQQNWKLILRNNSERFVQVELINPETMNSLYRTMYADAGQSGVVLLDNPNGSRFTTEDTPLAIGLRLSDSLDGTLLAETSAPITLHTVTP